MGEKSRKNRDCFPSLSLPSRERRALNRLHGVYPELVESVLAMTQRRIGNPLLILIFIDKMLKFVIFPNI